MSRATVVILAAAALLIAGVLALVLSGFVSELATVLTTPITESDILHDEGLVLFERYEESGDTTLLTRAIEKYRQTDELSPNDHELLNNWGICYRERYETTGDTAWLTIAIEKYKRASELKPDFALPYYNWGVALGLMYEYTGEMVWLVNAEAMFCGRQTCRLPQPHLLRHSLLSRPASRIRPSPIAFPVHITYIV